MMTRSICLVLLAALATGARVDDAETPLPQEEQAGSEEAQQAVQEQQPGSEEETDGSGSGSGSGLETKKITHQGKKYNCEEAEEEKPPTPLEIAKKEHKQAKAGQEQAKQVQQDKDLLHAKATDHEDMSYVMSVIKKSAAKEQGDKAQLAQAAETAAIAKRQNTAEKLANAQTHEDESHRLAVLHREEATNASAVKKDADASLEDATVRARFTKEQHELAAKAAEDAQAASELANEKAEKARAHKIETAKIRDESEQAKIARTEEAHAAATEAVHAVHGHYVADEHLKKMKQQAAKSKIDLAKATHKKQQAKVAAETAEVSTEKADIKAKESTWAAHGSVDRLATDTATALSSFSDKVNSQKEGELRVRKHTEARTVEKAANAAVLSAKRDKEIADAAVNETVGDLPSPAKLALVNPKGDKAKNISMTMAAEFPKEEAAEDADAADGAGSE